MIKKMVHEEMEKMKQELEELKKRYKEPLVDRQRECKLVKQSKRRKIKTLL